MDTGRQSAEEVVAPAARLIKHHAAVAYPTQVDDPTLGMPHLFYQVQDKSKLSLIAPVPYNVDLFILPPWCGGQAY